MAARPAERISIESSGAIRNGRLCVMDGPEHRCIDDGLLVWRDGLFEFAGAQREFDGELPDVMDAGGGLITPGFIDCHTHLVFAGDRANEFQARLAGASYEQIAKAGGGIVSTVTATRAATEEALFEQSIERARNLVAEGVTCIEIKSGYGLDFANEAKMLRVARRIGAELGISVRTTALCAHALPGEYAGRADDYIALVCDQLLPQLADAGLVDAVDAFCEGIGFSPAQVQRVFESAGSLGLPVKLHADQLSDLGGAGLLASHRGLSADHVEYTSTASIARMAGSGSVAVLLPGAFYFLGETRLPPIDGFRQAGVPMAVATDLNPGTSPLRSLRLAMNMACTLFGLTVDEALEGVTINAARALGLNDRGRLEAGHAADFAVWPVGSVGELIYWMGGLAPRQVFAAGTQIADDGRCLR